MPITVVPTLAFMADVYRCSAAGGASSERFRRYTAAAADSLPVHGYNPMTSKPVLATVEALLAIDAEARLAAIATATADALGFDADETMYLTVATPGMWTDRLATEVGHRLGATHPGGVLWWFEAPFDPDALDAELVAQTVRLVLASRSGPPTTLADAVDQEGRAIAWSGGPARYDDGAAEALAILRDDPSLSSMVAFLYGDGAAEAMGFTPLGLGDHVGYRHAAALAIRAGVEPAARPSPTS